MSLEQLFSIYKEQTIIGRYLTLNTVFPVLDKLNTNNQLQEIGRSVLHQPIFKFQTGKGKIKIFLWSQMHGNESTTTKALIDFLNFLDGGSELANEFLESFTFYCIPILNPDGAKLYTRENANKVDLNRDSQDLTQPESIILRKAYETFKPDFCFNLHDQRTIFGVSDTGKPATMSFLAPSFNKEREINTNRLKAINVIVAINETLKHFIPGQVGRFDDAFNINCIGDTFQFLGTPTLLFEAGHYQNDYEREKTRKYVFISFITSFIKLNENDLDANKIDEYLCIPQNKVTFYDFLYKNVKINYDGTEIFTNFVAQYKEVLVENQICFKAFIVEIGVENKYSGHFEYDANGACFEGKMNNQILLNQPATFALNDGTKFINGSIVN